MFAQLPMYDHPGVRVQTDALWAAIRDRLRSAGVDAPDALTRGDDLHAEWADPALLLGQTCGLPFRTELHHRVHLVGTIDYALPGAPSGHYYSWFVARETDPRDRLEQFDGARLAYNDRRSQSGWAAACSAPVRLNPAVETGSHRDSARAVQDGSAEIAALDAISLRLIREHTDLAKGLKVVGRSVAAPGMAIITAYREHLPALRAALTGGISDLPAQYRDALGIRGFLHSAPADYLAVPNPPSPEAYGASAA